MTEVPLQTLEELDLTAEEFEELVVEGLGNAVQRVMDTDDIEEALAQADQHALDVILAFWAVYVAETLVPSLGESMISAGLETVSRLAEALDNPLTLLIDQPLDVQNYLAQAQNRLVAIGDLLWFNAREQLAEGIALGESQPQLAARVRAAVGVSEPRARVIARTESHGARNVAAMATMQRFESAYGVAPGVMQKRWQATNDPRTRHTHVEADGQTVGLDAAFTVGGFPLAFPGDPTGPPAEVINCRCAPIVVFDPADLNLSDSGTIVTLSAAVIPEELDMPWSLERNHPECGEGQWAVVKDDTEELEGCHATRAEAVEQMRALYASEDDEDDNTLTAAVRRDGWSDIPVAAADRAWDGPGSAARVAAQCGVDEPDASAEAWDCYAEGFLYRDDGADPQTKGAYKLGVVDVIDGRKELIPRGVFAVAAVLQGARGGADIPAEQQATLRTVVAGLYDRINEELDTDHAVPWDRDASSLTAARTAIGGRNVAHWSGVVHMEGVPTAEPVPREFALGSLTWSPLGSSDSLEIPLGWKFQRAHGGMDTGNTVDVGRVDHIERIGNAIHASGVIDLDSPWGREAARQMGTRDNPGFLAGVSIIADDPKHAEVEYVIPEGCTETALDDGGEIEAACMVPQAEVYHSGRIRSVDLVSIPAQVEARVYLNEDTSIPEDEPEPEEVPAMAASAYTIIIPELPPVEWFQQPEEDPEIGAITVTDEGRFFGYVAPKQVAHRGIRNKRVEVPMKNVDYSIWMNRVTIADDGRGGFTKIATGPITMDCGHAPMSNRVTGAARREHYDNACSVVATARVGENARGVWIAGALIPGVSAEQVSRMMACQLSGDWGPHRERPGKRELAAALLVPVPGFPTAHRSFTMHNGELTHTMTPVRFGVSVGVHEPVGVHAAADRLAASIGRDPDTRARAFAAELQTILKGE